MSGNRISLYALSRLKLPYKLAFSRAAMKPLRIKAAFANRRSYGIAELRAQPIPAAAIGRRRKVGCAQSRCSSQLFSRPLKLKESAVQDHRRWFTAAQALRKDSHLKRNL